MDGITAGELRAMLAGLPDSTPVRCETATASWPPPNAIAARVESLHDGPAIVLYPDSDVSLSAGFLTSIPCGVQEAGQ
jgi:hypothetical protein